MFEDAAGIPRSLLQPLAQEIGYSETVFVYPGDQGTDRRIRIFTPANEAPSAGHPVLGAAVVVAAAGSKAVFFAMSSALDRAWHP